MDEGSITRLLRQVEEGAPGAEDRLFERVYAELRAMARARLAGEQAGGDEGGASDLVHDAFNRLNGEAFENRRHLFFAYARAMRQILVDRARRRNAEKRGGGRHAATLAPGQPDATTIDPAGADAMVVGELLERLKQAAPREAEVVLLRFFGGLSHADIAGVLGVSERTVRSDWTSARERMRRWV